MRVTAVELAVDNDARAEARADRDADRVPAALRRAVAEPRRTRRGWRRSRRKRAIRKRSVRMAASGTSRQSSAGANVTTPSAAQRDARRAHPDTTDRLARGPRRGEQSRRSFRTAPRRLARPSLHAGRTARTRWSPQDRTPRRTSWCRPRRPPRRRTRTHGRPATRRDVLAADGCPPHGIRFPPARQGDPPAGCRRPASAWPRSSRAAAPVPAAAVDRARRSKSITAARCPPCRSAASVFMPAPPAYYGPVSFMLSENIRQRRRRVKPGTPLSPPPLPNTAWSRFLREGPGVRVRFDNSLPPSYTGRGLAIKT